jgi:hypothetical protein
MASLAHFKIGTLTLAPPAGTGVNAENADFLSAKKNQLFSESKKSFVRLRSE